MNDHPPQLPKLPHPASRLRCLLVDDAPENLFLLSRILERLGCLVEVATNGAEALNQVQGQRYDFILMDMEMPVLDGFEATQRLRLQGYDRPIIALTAHCQTEEKNRCLASGCNAHLSKPVNFPILIQTIASYTGAELDLAD